jgi:16S rRNA processing protein RimM
MTYSSNILLGQIIKVSGYEGAVAVKLEKYFFENIPQMESVFLEVDGKPVPFFISYTEYSGADILKIKFEGYASIEKTAEFIGCKIFLTTNIPIVEKSLDYQDLNGFRIYNQNKELLGEISQVIHFPGQLLLSINSIDNKEILIPFHEDFILNVDKVSKVMVMNIPEGLTKINQ